MDGELFNAPIISSLIRTVVEDLDERGASKVEHELGVEGELVGETEGSGIVLVILTEFATQFDQLTIQPSVHKVKIRRRI